MAYPENLNKMTTIESFAFISNISSNNTITEAINALRVPDMLMQTNIF